MENSKGSHRFIKPSELTFIKMFIKYCRNNELITIFHLLLSIIIGNVIIWITINYIDSLFSLYSILFTISVSIFAVLITAFGLFAAITDISFLRIIYEMNELTNFLFPFWLTSVLWTGCIIISMLGQIVWPNASNNADLNIGILSISIYIVIIAIGYTLGLIGDIIRTTIIKVQMDYYKENIQKLDYSHQLIEISTRNHRFFNIYLSISCIAVLVVIISFLYPVNFFVFIAGVNVTAWSYITYKFYGKCKSNNDVLILTNIKRILKALIKLCILVLNYYIANKFILG